MNEEKACLDELQEHADKRIGPNTIPFQEVLEQEGLSVEEVNKIAEEIKFEE